MRFTMTRHVSILKPSVFMSLPAKDHNAKLLDRHVVCIQCKQKAGTMLTFCDDFV